MSRTDRSLGLNRVRLALGLLIATCAPAAADIIPIPPPGGGGLPTTPTPGAAPTIGTANYTARVGDNSTGLMQYTNQSGTQLLASPLSSSSSIGTGTTGNATQLQAMPQPFTLATASSTGTIGNLVQGGTYGTLISSSESTITYHFALIDNTAAAGAVGVVDISSLTEAGGDLAVPALDQPLGGAVSSYYAAGLTRWYYTNGNNNTLGVISSACAYGGTSPANTCDAFTPTTDQAAFTQTVLLNTDITIVVDSTAVTSGWADAASYADPIVTIDPAYAANNPNSSLEFSNGIGDSVDLPEPPAALLLAAPVIALLRRRKPTR